MLRCRALAAAPLAAAAALVLLGSPLTAQLALNLTGRIEKLPRPACGGATHRVRCTDVLLTSRSVDLSAFENRIAYLEGRIRLLPCPRIDVREIEAAPFSTTDFSLGGHRLGDTVIFTTRAPIGALVIYLFGERPGFTPIPVRDLGALMLGWRGLVVWKSAISVGVAISTLQIPRDPSLVGENVRYQTAHFGVAPRFGGRFHNPGCFVVKQR